MSIWTDLKGTTENLFRIGQSSLSAAGLTAARTQSLPDKSGTLAMLDDLSVGTVGDGDKGDITVSGLGDTWLIDEISRQVVFSGAIVATEFGTLNNYSPAGLSNAHYVSWEGAGSTYITGLDGGTVGRRITLANNTSNRVLCLPTNSALSLAANRFNFINFGRAAHVLLFPGEAIQLVYRGGAWTEEIPGLHRFYASNNFPRVLRASPNTGTGMASMGLATSSMGGTLSTPTPTASVRGQLFRTNGTTTATAGTSTGVRGTQNVCMRGNATGLGGFHFRIQFFFSTPPATISFFTGLYPTGTVGNVEANTLLNSVGFYGLVGETQLRVGSNDGSGTATANLLGTDFPISATPLYEAQIFALPNSSTIQLALTRLDDLTILPFIGSLTSDLPVNTQALTPLMWGNNRTTAAALDFAWGDLELRLP